MIICAFAFHFFFNITVKVENLNQVLRSLYSMVQCSILLFISFAHIYELSILLKASTFFQLCES